MERQNGGESTASPYRALVVALTVPLLALGLAACGGSETGPDGTTRLSIQLTDEASTSVSRAWVKVDQLTLHGPDEARVDLLDGPTGYIELTELAGRTRGLVSGRSVPSGEYEQLRFYVTSAALETEAGGVYSLNGGADAVGVAANGELRCPSCEQTGIKVVTPDSSLVLETESRILVLDFDVTESFGHQPGEEDTWIMRPVITSSTIGFSGSITGTVATDSGVSFPSCNGGDRSLQDFVPRVHAAGTDSVVKTGDVGSGGSYVIAYVPPGDYGMSYADTLILDPDSLFITASPSSASVTVESGVETTVDYSVSEVSCSSAAPEDTTTGG